MCTKHYSKDLFIQNLDDIDWSDIFNCHNVDIAWGKFKSILLSIIDKVAPYKEVRVKQRTKPWMSSEILNLIRQRDKYLQKFRRSKDQSDYKLFVYHRNQVKYKKEKAKSQYCVHAVNENQNRPKKLWQILKEIGASSKGKTSPKSISLNIENELCFDKQKVAEYFNDYFTYIASSLVEKLPPCSGRFGDAHVIDFYQNLNVSDNMFGLVSVTVDQVSSILNSISACKATGLDELPARFIKDGSSVIAKPLTHIVNLSITTGNIPDDLKAARVVPLYKKKGKTNVENYRPISVLSIISKVFEKVVFNQLNNFLTEHKLLYTFQSGFRSSYSTDTCLIHLTDYIKQECENGNYTGMVLLDLQKAFDTVDHVILLKKLSSVGVDELSICWFRSYLTGRVQVTDVDGTMSVAKGITCGVPQGSILGPLLFLLYINDMSAAVKCKLLLYVDDSVLLASGKDLVEIEATLSCELESVNNWLIDNKLSLHLGKTQFIVFGTRKKLCKCNTLNIVCKGNVIESKSTVTYLGVTLDQSLSGDVIASNVLFKTSNKLKFLYRNARNSI